MQFRVTRELDRMAGREFEAGEEVAKAQANGIVQVHQVGALAAFFSGQHDEAAQLITGYVHQDQVFLRSPFRFQAAGEVELAVLDEGCVAGTHGGCMQQWRHVSGEVAPYEGGLDLGESLWCEEVYALVGQSGKQLLAV